MSSLFGLCDYVCPVFDDWYVPPSPSFPIPDSDFSLERPTTERLHKRRKNPPISQAKEPKGQSMSCGFIEEDTLLSLIFLDMFQQMRNQGAYE